MDTLKGSINILTDKTDPANPIYKTLYPKTRADQVEGFDDRVKDLVGDTITVSGTAGSRKTIIGSLQADAISTSTGAAISATVTNATNATNASKDINNKDLTEYIGSVSAVSGYNNQINVKTGAQMKAGSAGNTITINNVENAQKDANGTAITGYIGSIAAGSTANKIVVKTGAQVHDNAAGTEITINNVANATNATNATSATSATSAGKATNDANGNAITGYVHSVALKSGANNTLVVKTGADYKNNTAGTEVVINNVANATSATKDSASQTISSTYIKGLSVSGTTLTYTKGDNSTGTVTLPETGITTDTNDKVTNTLNTTAKAYITGTTSATTNTGTQIFDTGVYLSTTAGELVATKFTGALNGNATSATKAAQDGSGQVIADTYATKSVATTSANGLMSSTDKSKLDTILLNNLATCADSAYVAAKTATISGFKLTAGARAVIKFTNGNLHTSPTLNISETSAKNIKYNNGNLTNKLISANSIIEVIYDGTQYNIIGILDSNDDTEMKANESIAAFGIRCLNKAGNVRNTNWVNIYTETASSVETGLIISKVSRYSADKSIIKPSINTIFINNGSIYKPFEGINTSGIIITGDTEASASGNYEAQLALQPGYVWSDGTKSTYVLPWSIVTITAIGIKYKVTGTTGSTTPTRYINWFNQDAAGIDMYIPNNHRYVR